MSDQQDPTTATDATPAEGDGSVTYYYDDNALFRERDGWPPEVLNGEKWVFWPEPTSRMSAIDEAEAQQLAGDVPLDAPNAGVAKARAGEDGSDGEA